MASCARTTGLVLVLVLLVSVAAPGGAWQVAEQPDLADAIKNAKPIEVERLPAVPVRSIRVAGVMWAPSPDGKTCDLIQIYYGQNLRNNWIVVVDFSDDSIKVTKQPEYCNWHLAWGRSAAVTADGRLFTSTMAPRKVEGKNYYCQHLNMYDPKTNEMRLTVVETPHTLLGETHPLILGTDGKLYMIGQHPSHAAGAVQVDPGTLAVKDFGPIGPSHAPNACWGYFGAADDRYIYIGSGKIPWYLVAYDRQTGKSNVLMTTDNRGIVGIWYTRKDGRLTINVRATNVVAIGGEKVEMKKKVWAWLKDGRLLPRESANQTPPEEAYYKDPHYALPPLPELYRGNVAPTSEGKAEIWARTPEAKAAAPKEPPPDPANAGPEDLGWKRYAFEIEPHPEFIYRLTELPDGRMLGAAGAYEGNFTYDPKTGEHEHLGKTHLSVYCTAILDNKVYMSGYPTSPVYVYDLSKPWNAGRIGVGRPGEKPLPETDPESNPRLLGRLNEAGAHKMYAAAVGADGRVYFGGRWYRNGSGGGFGWWDPKEKKAGGIWKPFSNYQVLDITAAAEGRYIVVSTRRIRDAVLNKPTPEQGRLFVFDTRTHEIVRSLDPVEKAVGTGFVEGVTGGPRVIGLTQDGANDDQSILYGVDVEKGEVAFRRTLSFKLDVRIGSNQKERWDYRLGPDGCIWTFINQVLVRIHPEDARVEVLGEMRFTNWHNAKGPGRIAFSGRDIYLAGYQQLRRVKGIVPAN